MSGGYMAVKDPLAVQMELKSAFRSRLSAITANLCGEVAADGVLRKRFGKNQNEKKR